MGQIAEDMTEGRCCQICGVYFEEEHGYPVLCETCYDLLNENDKKGYSKSIYPEL